MPRYVSDEDVVRTVETVERCQGNLQEAAKELGVHRSTVVNRLEMAEDRGLLEAREKEKAKLQRHKKFEKIEHDNSIEITYIGTEVKTEEELVKESNVDLDFWERDKLTVNYWPVGGKAKQGQDENGRNKPDKLWRMQLCQIKMTFRRKSDDRVALQNLLEMIEKRSKDLIIKPKKIKGTKRRKIALEIAIMDPHMGLMCKTPQADQEWDLDLCEQFYLFAVEDLIRQAQMIGDIGKIFWIFGNDFNHADNLEGSTTKYTNQPENVAQHESILRGEQLAISAVQSMLEHAPVEAFQVPGNHDNLTSYMMGRVLNARFHDVPDFKIDASCTPFKHFRYGASLVGMEHGHSIAPIRLVGIMANEWRDHWSETHYHEWHCGDQHRKGSSKPSVFEEQGVSVEFLPGLVAPNQWHRMKAFNFQKRAANGFIWDYDCGQTHRITTNISKYTGSWLGSDYDDWLAKRTA